MTNVVVVGSQWGDEGKGKIVDWLASKADAVVRFQGGANAGHTLVIDGVTYKLSLLPSGIVRSGLMAVIGNGVVLDPWSFTEEIESVRAMGLNITHENLLIAENTTLILPLHRELDGLREKAAGKGKIGTTGRGIGPAYEDKVGRRAIRAQDLFDFDSLKPKIDKLVNHHNILRRGMGEQELRADDVYIQLTEIAPAILPYIGLVWKHLDEMKKAGRPILFEGAQGALLDIDHGTYPYVTSSNTIAGNAAIGSGIGPTDIDYVLGITKAYTTRVGEGPFPTELFDADGKHMADIGREFGTVTQRPRRCGWFDATLVRQTCKISGINGIALTKLDVLDGMKELKICTGYMLDGKEIDYFPSEQNAQANVEPIYETMPGWSDTTAGSRNWDDLPAAALAYIKRIEQLVEVPIAVVSTSPEREDTILVLDPFKMKRS